MAYTPPSCNAITLDFTGSYTPPACNAIVLTFGESGGTTTDEIVSSAISALVSPGGHTIQGERYDAIIAGGVLARLSPSGHSVSETPAAIAGSGVTAGISLPGHTLYEIVEIAHGGVSLPGLISSGIISGGGESDLPVGVSAHPGGICWGGNIQRQKHIVSGWDDVTAIDPSIRIGHDATDPHQRNVDIPWGKTDEVDEQTRIPWDRLTVREAVTGDAWHVLGVEDAHTRIPWDEFGQADHQARIPYLEPGARDRHHEVVWDSFDEKDRQVIIPYLEPGARDRHHMVQWGPLDNFAFCFSKYWPPKCGEIELQFDVPVLAGVCEGITLYFDNHLDDPRCPFLHWRTGWRDKYPAIIIEPHDIWPPRLRVYYMANTILFKRLPDNVPFDALSVSMQLDVDSWLWSFQMEIPSRAFLDLIKPQGGTLIDVEIAVNGWKWICRVEGWHESAAFGRRSWTVTGRSPSAELGDPYCTRQSYVSTVATQGSQFVTDILQYSGWSHSWAASDYLDPLTGWLIPAGAFTYQDQTKIGAIQQLAAAVGAIIQTPPDTVTTPTLTIKPRFPVSPWQWVGVTPEVGIIDAQFEEVGRNWMPAPLYNAVVVAGVNYGKIVSVKRTGTAGDKQAPTFTSDLICTDGAGRESGRIIMGRSGNWIKHTIRLFSLYPDGTPPGLLVPGTMIAVQEGATTWNGQVTGTTIAASNVSREVRQTIEVEEYADV